MLEGRWLGLAVHGTGAPDMGQELGDKTTWS